MKTILVATDFSPAALNAAAYAADMAATINAGILLLHVYHLPVIYSEVPVAINKEAAIKEAEKEIEKIKRVLVDKTKGKINIEIEIREGIFFEELKKACEQIHPYTVIMGSQGTTAAERLLFGAHTVYAAKNLKWPLITVPAGAKFLAIKKIGLACDFYNVADATPIDEIKMLVKDFTAELHLLNTGKEEVFDPEIVFQSGLMEEILEDIKPQYHFITNKNTDDAIIDFAEKNNIDLLVVLPRRHSLLDKIMHKSHTKQLILHSHVPVMALHH